MTNSARTEVFFAHSMPGMSDTRYWEPLERHVRQVAELASDFSSSFGSRDWGFLAGLWHDIGKYSHEFQSYLLKSGNADTHIEEKSKVDHSTAGAQHAVETSSPWGRLLAYAIAGHHAGLSDASGSQSSLDGRLKKKICSFSNVTDELARPVVKLAAPKLNFDTSSQDKVGFQLAFFLRMVFSCLVDADFLATEEFMSPDRSIERPVYRTKFYQMFATLESMLAKKSESAIPGTVKQCRQSVLSSCISVAAERAGFFSLTVPTGGGKTFSSLAFALKHAALHKKSRVIYAIPFTSIIEQTANVFRDVFSNLGEDVVLEHHSNVDPLFEDHQSRLACENWDAPLIVTTNVQLLESLFAAKTSRCRKLHRISNSVIILDEAQTLPVEMLRPCLAALEELVRNYGCTILLCTATQPAIELRDRFPIGLRNVRKIIGDPEKLYLDMKRVCVTCLGRLTDEQLLERMLKHESFLGIVNTKPHASKLYKMLLDSSDDRSSLFHLSTLMCGQHRSDVIRQIHNRLAERKRCRVISTQLIEAGVDVDFPVVFRAMAGIDSIAQAAGRCNREGKLAMGEVFVFEEAEIRLRGSLSATAETAREILPDFNDLLSPEAVQRYFEHHYWRQGASNQDKRDQWDTKQTMKCFPYGSDFPFDFRTASERFRIIEDEGQTVFVPYGADGNGLCEELRKSGPSRQLLRRLQRYSVKLYEHQVASMRLDITMEHDDYAILSNPSAYDDKLGVRIDRPGFIDSEHSIC